LASLIRRLTSLLSDSTVGIRRLPRHCREIKLFDLGLIEPTAVLGPMVDG